MKKIKDIIDYLDSDYAQLYPPALDGDIESANRELQSLGVSKLPLGLVNFFKICDGLEYNGMVIYGTHNNQIVKHNEDRHYYYKEFSHLIFFGSIDDDIYTYNTKSQMYESRDINGMECWEEYDSFEGFFLGEILQWLS